MQHVQPKVAPPATDEMEIDEQQKVIDGRTVLEHLEDAFGQTVVLEVEHAGDPLIGMFNGFIAGAMIWGVLVLLGFWLL